jgi:hypothetical protein
MASAKKSSPRRASKETSSKSKKASTTAKANPCWPGFEPVPGKAPRTKGSCKPKPGPHDKPTRRATRKAAAASKLEKQNS